MELRHLSLYEINDFINGNSSKAIDKHLAQCPQCRQEVAFHKSIIAESKNIQIYEPQAGLTDRVMANLPELYHAKEKPVFEVMTLLSVLVPFVLVIGYLFMAQFSGNGLLNGLQHSASAVINSITAYHLFSNNMHIFGMFALYAAIFKIADMLIIMSRKMAMSNQ